MYTTRRICSQRNFEHVTAIPIVHFGLQQLLAIIVEEESSIAAFKDYQPPAVTASQPQVAR